MKLMRLLLLFFLIPSLIYSSPYYQDKYNRDLKKLIERWDKHNACIKKFTELREKHSLPQQNTCALLKEAISYCDSALRKCDRILHRLDIKSKSERKDWVNYRKTIEDLKGTLATEIKNIQTLIDNTHKDAAYTKAISFHQQSEQKAHEAHEKIKDYTIDIHQIESAVTLFDNVASLYEEASSLASIAHDKISQYPDEESKNVLATAATTYKAHSEKYKQEAIEIPKVIAKQKASLLDALTSLEQDSLLFKEKGFDRIAYDVQKHMLPILKKLIDSTSGSEHSYFVEKNTSATRSIEEFELSADKNRLSEIIYSPSQDLFKEKERRANFFTNNTKESSTLFERKKTEESSLPCAISLDGYVNKQEKNFTVYANQFYRFLLQAPSKPSQLVVTVYEKEDPIHKELIDLPCKDPLSWHKYITTEGMVYIPDTKLKACYGLDLRLHVAYDPTHPFAMIISQKGINTTYRFSFSLDGISPLYTSTFFMSPPWQLDVLKKPSSASLATLNKTEDTVLTAQIIEDDTVPSSYDMPGYPLLDEIVERHKKDPLLLTQYVYHEIDLIDPFMEKENGIFLAPAIHRSPLMTHLQKQGSPWEQCNLLVYLLRKAGYKASCVIGDPLSLPKAYIEKMFLSRLAKDKREALVKYPW
ncbi:MAG: hypothetical protein FJZ57_05700, partial [Chlamydiae bacterium]|nr:hypothetical protein [Chlamydiota bacterium]